MIEICVGLFLLKYYSSITNYVCLRSTVLFLEVAVPWSVNNFAAFYGTRRYTPPLITVLKQIKPVQCCPSYYFKMYFSIIAHLVLDLLSGVFPFSIPIKDFFIFLHFSTLSYMLHDPTNPFTFSCKCNI
jgi:hypothetical protein